MAVYPAVLMLPRAFVPWALGNLIASRCTSHISLFPWSCGCCPLAALPVFPRWTSFVPLFSVNAYVSPVSSSCFLSLHAGCCRHSGHAVMCLHDMCFVISKQEALFSCWSPPRWKCHTCATYSHLNHMLHATCFSWNTPTDHLSCSFFSTSCCSSPACQTPPHLLPFTPLCVPCSRSASSLASSRTPWPAPLCPPCTSGMLPWAPEPKSGVPTLTPSAPAVAAA